MTHNVKSELRRSMDAIHFSGDDKERMVALLMSAEAPRQRRSGKKLLLLALAATLVVGALTGAAVFTRICIFLMVACVISQAVFSKLATDRFDIPTYINLVPALLAFIMNFLLHPI